MTDKLLVQLTEQEFRQIIRDEMNRETQTEDQWMTVHQASEYLKTPVDSLYKLTSARQIPFHRDNNDKRGRLYFSRKELDEWRRS